MTESQKAPEIFADFNNFDEDGYLRLSVAGAKADLERLGLNLTEGLYLICSDGDVKADIIVVAPGREGIWRGRVCGPIEDVPE